MNRLTDNDKNFGPFTFARWGKRISLELRSGDDEDPECHFLAVGFGWAFRLHLPTLLKPFGKYGEHRRSYGFSLCDMGNGYDFITFEYGPQTHDSSTTKSWSKHLPWKQWDHVRHSYYNPEGTHFATDPVGRGKWEECNKLSESCPTVHFEFEDYDGKRIVATCKIEEREWHRGEGWFKWLKHFYPVKIRRSLDLRFSDEVGPEKGSWKGGTIGTGCDMLPGETPEQAFRHYCEKLHSSKGNNYMIKFIGPSEAAPPRPPAE